ncbi:NHLP bacteriocin system secretion protein [Rhizobium sp. AQ_MP]|uniref:NHLP bacteriocin system secretion protein n=1 Tax=Rhizobium sp. AQ_MP TaxID=2761536 RepID=UPI0016399914|nr:NHLP bacteriocin system secretion protein [Rhizobium sp. AQ_MP]MBC2774551.1 NHLP bacteriocin system secretion protein [Rhizobium sp. AQ_MP]
MSADKLFRQEALQKLASPERLDEAVQINSRGTWVAVMAFVVLALLFGLWSVIGRIPSRVNGQGILLLSGGNVVDTVAMASGTLVGQGVAPGVAVTSGMTIARIEQPDVKLRLVDVESRLERLTASRQQAVLDEGRLRQARLSNTEARRVAYQGKSRDARQRLEAYQAQLKRQEKLVVTGALAVAALQQTREQIELAAQDLSNVEASLLEMEASGFASDAESRRLINSLDQEVSKVRAERDQLAQTLREFGTVQAIETGTLVEWKVPSGTYIASGTPVASIATGDGLLEMRLFLPPASGKRVRPGMRVDIEISGLPREQWGTLTGHVRSVSDFPATREGMRAILQNDTLVSSFSGDGAPFTAVVTLDPDPSAPSGYRWVGGPGPGQALSHGAIGKAKVTIEERAPIDFLVPMIRKLTSV